MLWIAPSAKDSATATLGKRLWDAADQLRVNSGPKSLERSAPSLGLFFTEVIGSYQTLKQDADAYGRVKELLLARVDFSKPLPQKCVHWSDLAQLQAALSK